MDVETKECVKNFQEFQHAIPCRLVISSLCSN